MCTAVGTLFLIFAISNTVFNLSWTTCVWNLFSSPSMVPRCFLSFSIDCIVDLLFLHVGLVSEIFVSYHSPTFAAKRRMTIYFVQPWASYQIRKIAVCACPGNARNVFPSHRGIATPTCITTRAWHTCLWCKSGSLTSDLLWSRWRGSVPSNPGACENRNFTYLVRASWTVELLDGYKLQI